MISIIYAHRNRDAARIKASFFSLSQQKIQNFEVVFVDYGSGEELSKELQRIAEDFSFVRFYHLPVPQLLWNKSKALNYGIVKAKGEYIFIADADLIFHPEATTLWQHLQNPEKFHLFRLGYLDKTESLKFSPHYKFENLNPARFGDVNGMILSSKKSFEEVNGLDEFFHFYGAEDEDLFGRLENSGYQRELREEKYFYHQWHKSFIGSENKLLLKNPRINNIMRINHRHFQRNSERGVIRPPRQPEMGSSIDPERAKALVYPDFKFQIPNMLILIEHFLREELPSRRGEVVQVEFFVDNYYRSLKYKLKKLAGMQAQTYVSLKFINDLVLKEILYNYRDHNYTYKLEDDLSRIIFCLEV